MSGIYIHIPFCKQACNYCDFHFSTTMKKKDAMVEALVREIELRKAESGGELIDTIYFGGGTPSVLTNAEIEMLVDTVFKNFELAPDPEITIEVNPDDLFPGRLKALSTTKINRLSIGIQSFFDKDLKLMNRAHNSVEAERVLVEAAQFFDNVSVDLIYGIPGLTDSQWRENIAKVLSAGIRHISSYALTVEPRTALEKMISQGKVAAPDDSQSLRQFEILTEMLNAAGFVHYEISNFGKPGYFSRNNSAYWLGKKYIGIGPSAHSFDGMSRSWNIANNALYIKAIENNELPLEREFLTARDRFNEYVMTGLRTIWGVSLGKVKADFGDDFLIHLQKSSAKYVNDGFLEVDNDVLKTTAAGKFLADGIASDLFLINLDQSL